ncbi:MAG TPA: MurR/RpiR family transcriptional regulator [Microlunatus sp.]
MSQPAEDRGTGDRSGSGVASSPRPVRALSVLIKIRRALPNLRPAEQRVAQAVLDDPAGVSESSITTVAKLCETSETTVLRFCRAIGLAGYPELRIALARAAQWEETDQDNGAPITGRISQTDSLSDVVSKIAYADSRAISDTARALDLQMLERVVDALAGARRIDIFGTGASGLVGQDLHHKLHRIGLTSFTWPDSHLALTAAAVLKPEDVALAFSHSGTTADTIDVLKVARRHGATTIAVTNFDQSPISQHCDLLLVTAAHETAFRSGAMSSRIAQLALVDCIFAGVAQRSYEESVEAIESSYAAVESRHLSRGGR